MITKRCSLFAVVLTVMAGAPLGGQEVSAALKQADAAYRAGQAALARRDLGAAQADFEQVVKLAPAAEQGHSALGAVLLGRGHAREAIGELEAALALKRTDGIAQENLARAYQDAGMPRRAVPVYAELLRGAKAQGRSLRPDLLAGYAQALVAAGSLTQAAAAMKSAVAGEPRSAELHDALGSILAQEKMWPEAEREFGQAVQLNPGLAMAHLHLGLAEQGQGKSGAEQLAEAARLAPGNPVIALERGKALAAAGQDGPAMVEFQRVLGTDAPQSGATWKEAMYEMALALQRSNRVEEAMGLFRKVLAAEPDNSGALINLGMALTQAQRAKEAVPVLQHAVRVDGEAAVAHENLAAAYVQLSQLEDAVKELHAALKLAPDSPQVHYDLGLALKMQDHPEEAIPQLEAAERLDPGSPEAPYALGLLYLQAGRYEDAAREMKHSLELRPENGDGWATLGSVYSKLDKLPEATAALREAVRQLPNQPDPHLTLAGVLAKENQPAEAMAERRKAAELMRGNMNRQRAEVATHAGNGLLKNGDLAGAEERFRNAISYDSSYGEAHLGLAKVMDREGKGVEAAAERERAGVESK